MVSITVSAAASQPASARGLPCTVEIPGTIDKVTVGDVKAALVAKFPRLSADRQKISLKDSKIALNPETTLSSVGVTDGGELTVKDLGPQISWKTVFLIEYAGPLVVHPLIYHLSTLFYGTTVQHSVLQKFVYVSIMIHFIKRELETLFVHRFSHDTMPFRNVFKNSAHYHLMSGVVLAYALYSPTYSATSSYITGTYRADPRVIITGTAIWLFAELSNLKTHLTLRNLRPAGTRQRAIPYGYGFNLVSCPNYFFEAISWGVIAVLSGSWAAYGFLALSTYQMAIWADKKHRTYKKEFGKEYPRRRKAMFPFIY